ncbi:adhesin [Budvicia aquatica]|uniref:Adhesin n=1 Tax=Budvicia aquatica TaxID=82979 RepID=A0A2C6DHN6_9GAMM|nr:hypothetical protein CRN84_02445 [Budvicia aquatica]VFS46158.1 adhesin [Budvicia aquatica]
MPIIAPIETGKRYALGAGLSLTPQTQLTYSRVDFDDFRDPFGSKVSLQEGDSLRGRLGVSLDKDIIWRAEDGTTRRSHVYGNVDVYNEFMNGTKTHVSGVDFSSRDKRQSVGVGVGGTHEWHNIRNRRKTVQTDGVQKINGCENMGMIYVSVRW